MILIAPLAAQNSGASFLEVDPSPRSYALGSAGSAVAVGAQAMGQNPANLGLSAQPYEAFASYETLLGGAEYEHAALALQPPSIVPRVDSIGFSLTRWAISGLVGADTSGNPTGGFSADRMAIAMGASSVLSDQLRVGLAVKTVRSQIGSFNSNWALCGDLGLSFLVPREGREIALVFSADHVGQGLKFVSQTDPLPTSLQAGASYPVGGTGLAVGQVRHYVYDGTAQASLGYEYDLGPAAFRLGYAYFFGSPSNLALSDQSTAQKVLGGLTGGVGLRWGAAELDYAVSQQAVGYGPTQRVALTVAWGVKEERRATKRRAARTIYSPW